MRRPYKLVTEYAHYACFSHPEGGFLHASFVKYTIESRVESTTACPMRAWQIWHPSTVWMHPFAIKGLESQYTGNATPPRGDTDGTVTTRGLMTTSR